jgi:hypothetical protein
MGRGMDGAGRGDGRAEMGWVMDQERTLGRVEGEGERRGRLKVYNGIELLMGFVLVHFAQTIRYVTRLDKPATSFRFATGRGRNGI